MSTALVGELIVLDTSNPVAIFEGGLGDVLDAIEREVKAHTPDITTDKGRKAIASLAYKVAQSKTALDELGKNLVADWKAKSAAVDAERRRLRERLDALKEEVRRPLTEWEQAEKRRVAEHEAQIAVIAKRAEDARTNWQTMDMADMKWALGSLSIFDAYDWEEFHARGEAAIAHAADCLKEAIDRRTKYDAEQAELARLRQEAAERAKKEHEERIAKEAAERAKREAEAKAQREREALEAQKRKAEEDAKTAEAAKLKAEQDAVRAKEQAKKDAEAAAARERALVEREQEQARLKKAKADEAAAKRKAVREAIVNDIQEAVGCGYDYADAMLQAIIQGKIRYVRLTSEERA